MTELTYHKAPKHEDYLIEVTGHSFGWLAVEPGIHRCGKIEDGVALAHWNCEEPRGKGQAEGGWVISFADLEAFYLAAKAHRANTQWKRITVNKLQKNCITVLNRLVKMCEEDDEFAQSLASDLDTMLNDIHSQDGFGTEGQSDPRGDFRNGRWSMKKVESDSAHPQRTGE